VSPHTISDTCRLPQSSDASQLPATSTRIEGAPNPKHGTSLRTILLCVFVFVLALLASAPASATTYYLSPSGNDASLGTSSTSAWLTPNHALNCGDVIQAAAGTYNNANFYTGRWGTVSCPGKNSVAWLKCATFDGCKIYATVNQGMWVDESFWGVEGWEVSTTASDTYGTCFLASPRYSNPVTIHHIIFANDVANGCAQSGFASANRGSAGVDYFNVLASIAFNATQGSNSCSSGISVFQPVQSDTAAGTHIYIAGNFTYANLDPSICNGSRPTDGEGIIFDQFDGSQSGISSYWSQAVAYSNIVVGNGSKGIEVNNNQAGSYNASIWINQNTVWGNNTDPNQTWYGCSEISTVYAHNVHLYGNLASTRSATGCGGNAIYALGVSAGNTTDTADNNFAYGYNGNNTFVYDSGSFAWNSDNHFGVSPSFTTPAVPGSPSCGGTANAPACMSALTQHFVPQAANSISYGYQKPLSSPVSDALFPSWLCSANIPTGLITMGCS
jgi:hypothetical protein